LNVLRGINLTVQPDELVSLVGPNGAGKTTLMRCLSDGTETIGGSVSVRGANIAGLAPDAIVALGVGRKFQVASVFDSLTVAECLRMARAARHAPSLVHGSQELDLPPAAVEILKLTALDGMLDRP
ncbi:High-affinity branched-chain amino acid transport ATP-binding protein LivG, partial [Trichinella pseudospiralis]